MSLPIATPEVLLAGLAATECPRWHGSELYVSDMHGGVVLAVTEDGRSRIVAEVEGTPAGLGWLPDGSLLVVSQEQRRVLRVADDGIAVHADLGSFGDSPLNDMWVLPDGTAYVGEMGFDIHAFNHPEKAAPEFRLGQVYRVGLDGSAAPATPEGLRFPNGIVPDPNGTGMLVAESFGFAITALHRAASGELEPAGTWAQLTFAPDGIAADAEGCLWVADPMGNRAVRVAPGGEELEVITTEHKCLAVALGGSDGRTLALCTTPVTGAEEARDVLGSRVERVTVEIPAPSHA